MKGAENMPAYICFAAESSGKRNEVLLKRSKVRHDRTFNSFRSGGLCSLGDKGEGTPILVIGPQ